VFFVSFVVKILQVLVISQRLKASADALTSGERFFRARDRSGNLFLPLDGKKNWSG
jgi:hypothetical protein